MTVWAIMPAHGEVPERSLVEEVLRHVEGLVIVDDGSEEPVARALEARAAEFGAILVRLPARQGKGAALRAGLAVVPESADAVLTIDADGQHPASAIPAFLAAASSAELVIGDRFDDLPSMPWQRRLANRASRRLLELSTRRGVRDTQCGMRRRRLRGGDPPPQGRARERPRRRLGAYPCDLRRRDELVPGASRFRARPRSARTIQRTTYTVANPIATPSRLPTSTSDQ
jgi:glycosyltransferase involved in cell wall biosynthesis